MRKIRLVGENSILIFALLLFLQQRLLAQEQADQIPFDQAYKRSYNASRLISLPPITDGVIDDQAWKNDGVWSQGFIQNIPVERGYPSYNTRFKILYDNRYLYFALIASDPDPEGINRFVGNRDDNSMGDLISVAFDTYHDYRAAVEFNINAGGNKTDLIVTDNLTINLSWNAVWEGRTSVNDSSWCAEFRIPFSQLRFNPSDTGMVWGLHVRRIVRRIQETDQWSLIPRKNSGHVYSFGTMTGLEGVPKPKLVEFLPYTAVKAVSEPRVPGSTYFSGFRWKGTAGIDAKIGAGDFTLDLTVNPDFGQVEADPSVMNLTALETFYEEKRPFFLEGKHIFDFAADNNMLFYSRRIGDAPSYKLPADNVSSFAQAPELTSIIDAVKLSGTTRKGISVGLLQSVTQEERARFTENGVESRPVVEPLTNYLVARVQKTAEKGNAQTGVIFTSTNRFIRDSSLYFLPANAFTGGIDFIGYTRGRDYFTDIKAMASLVEGESLAITSLQRNALHYYQRPDAAGYLGVDSTLRSLSGTGGYLSAGRLGNRKFIFSEKVSWWSPGFDINDAGYFLMADLVENVTQAGIRQTVPGKRLRNYTLSFGQKNAWTFGGLGTYSDLSVQFKGQFTSRTDLNATGGWVFSEMNTRLLRGGPAYRSDPYWKSAIQVNTDKSKRMVLSLGSTGLLSSDGVSRQLTVQPGVSFRIGNHIYLATDFKYSDINDGFQYVTQQNAGEELMYILARISQQTYNLTFRLNYNITPDLSLQYYGSPFVSAGKYSDFKKVSDAHSYEAGSRYHTFTDSEISYDSANDIYTVTEGGNSYSFGNPDFSFRQFRSNFVVRWEYRRGSTLYFVWEKGMNNRAGEYTPSYGDNLEELFSTEASDIFMVKLSFWLGL